MSVQNVNDAQLQQLLQQQPKVLVKYYADWCGNCKLIAPKYSRLAEQTPEVAFVEINAEENPESRKLAEVSNLPFFASFRQGELVEGVPTSRIEYVTQMAQSL